MYFGLTEERAVQPSGSGRSIDVLRRSERLGSAPGNAAKNWINYRSPFGSGWESLNLKSRRLWNGIPAVLPVLWLTSNRTPRRKATDRLPREAQTSQCGSPPRESRFSVPCSALFEEHDRGCPELRCAGGLHGGRRKGQSDSLLGRSAARSWGDGVHLRSNRRRNGAPIERIED